MRKKQILILIAVMALGATLFMVNDIAKKARSKSSSTLISLHALTLDSTAVEINFINADTSLVIIFNSECDICRIELESLLINYPKLERYNILLLSSQNINELLRIEANYNLSAYPTFKLLKMDELRTAEIFLSASNPSLFVFDSNGKLVLKKKGYTNPEQLIYKLK